MHSRFIPALASAVLVLTVLQSQALETASHFSDHMVLQRDAKVPIWGTAAPGAKVTVSFAGQTVSGKADKSGSWRVELTPMSASAQDRTLTVTGDGRKQTLKNVLVGDVWLGSGQSNMAGRTSGYAKKDPTLAALVEAAPYPAIRLLRGGPKPVWETATKDTVNQFSAILFAFGERLHRELNVPIGLMVGAVGGTPSGAWLPAETFADSKRCQDEIANFAKTWNRERAQKQYEAKLAVWEKLAPKAKAEGKRARGRKPQPPGEPGESTRGRKTGSLFDTYIRFGVGTAIKGVLWDQGEAGSGILGLTQYTSMSELIHGWRELWGQGEFPFLFVQKPSGLGNAWSKEDPITREADTFQPKLPDIARAGDGASRYLYTRLMLDNPNAWMVPACDLGPMVHPLNKWGYGNRAAQVALQKAYHRTDVQAYGPVYSAHRIQGGEVHVKFTEVGDGLAVRHGRSLHGFALAGQDGKWHWADARIAGKDSLVVTCPEVAKPVHVRFAWSQNRQWANLFNQSGRPALAFTTEPDVDFTR